MLHLSASQIRWINKSLKILFLSALGIIVFFILLVAGYIFYVNLPEKTVAQRDPVSGLQYQIPEKYLKSEDFRLIVKEVTADKIPPINLRYEEREEVKNEMGLSWISGEAGVTDQGFPYTHVEQVKCFENYVVSLNLADNAGKKLIRCSDISYGSILDEYYVTVDGKIYLFTTDEPTRVVYYDPHLAKLPQRISPQHFQELIESLMP